MASKSLPILALATAISVAAAAWAVVDRQQSTSIAAVPDALFPDLMGRVNEVATVSVTNPGLSFSIVKGDDGSWQVPERGGYAVKFETVKQAVVGIAGLAPLAGKTARAELHHKLHLKTPADGGKGTVITLKDKTGGEIAGVVIGITKSTPSSTRAGWHYVRRASEDQTWLAAGRVEVWDKIDRWLDNDMPVIDRARIHRVRTEKPNGEIIHIGKDEPGARDFKALDLPEGWELIHMTAANALGSAIGFLSFEDVKPVAEIAFDDPVMAEYATFDGLVFKLDLVQRKGVYWARIAASFDDRRIALDKLPEDKRSKMKKADEVEAEAEKINARYGTWAYRLSKYKGKDFTIGRDEVVHKKEKKDKDG
jgi:hypothetical protein